MTGRVVTVSFDDTIETNVELVEQAGFTTFFFSKTGRCKVPCLIAICCARQDT
jgi:hypothetical protein